MLIFEKTFYMYGVARGSLPILPPRVVLICRLIYVKRQIEILAAVFPGSDRLGVAPVLLDLCAHFCPFHVLTSNAFERTKIFFEGLRP